MKNDWAAMLMLLLYEGLNPNAFAENESYLGLACRHVAWGCISVLLNFGADPNVPSLKDGEYPLHAIIASRKAESNTHIITELVRCGADINARANDGATAFYNACSKTSHRTDGKRLLGVFREQEADINIATNEGYTPLMLAASSGNEAFVDLLVRWKVDVSARDENGHTALWYAERNANKAVAERLRAAGAML